MVCSELGSSNVRKRNCSLYLFVYGSATVQNRCVIVCILGTVLLNRLCDRLPSSFLERL